jgi:predicted transcriptional regulator
MSTRARNELESQILAVLWDAKANQTEPLSSQQIVDALKPSGDLAITTVLTVLSRLGDKGLVNREPGEGRSLMFSAAQSREAHNADLMLRILDTSENPALAFSHFASGLSAEQLAQLKKSLNDN